MPDSFLSRYLGPYDLWVFRPVVSESAQDPGLDKSGLSELPKDGHAVLCPGHSGEPVIEIADHCRHRRRGIDQQEFGQKHMAAGHKHAVYLV